MNWNEIHHAGDTWEKDGDIALVGYVKRDGEFTASSYPNDTTSLEAGMPVYAVFSMDRSDGVNLGFDVWLQDFFGNVSWLEGADGEDLLDYYTAWFEWTEDAMDDVRDRYYSGEFD